MVLKMNQNKKSRGTKRIRINKSRFQKMEKMMKTRSRMTMRNSQRLLLNKESKLINHLKLLKPLKKRPSLRSLQKPVKKRFNLRNHYLLNKKTI